MTNLDLAAIRRSAERGEPQLSATVVALVERITDLEISARVLIDTASRINVASHEDSVQLSRATLQLWNVLGGGKSPIILAVRAYFDAVDRCDGIALAEQALRWAVEQTGV